MSEQVADWWTATHPREGVSYLDLTVRGYVACALWSSTGDDETPLDCDYGPYDIDAETRNKMRDDCRTFLAIEIGRASCRERV